jgi:hypothetical protein
LSAVLVTLRAAEVLIRNGCAFKVAVGLPHLHELVSVNADRGTSGKVITAYPADDEQFVRLAEELHQVTEHLPGPAILSDRPYRPGSLVHYRYGAFTGRTVLSNDGSYESMLVAPDGALVKDRRLAWFSPPPWVACPLDDEAGAVPQSADAVLLADRFVVRQAIRHGNKGGVYLGAEQTTGEEVVIKQARSHIGAMLDGTDARDRLRHEAALLGQLAPLGLTPRPVQLFEQQGHLFLAQERIPGITLAAWVSERTDCHPPVPAWPGRSPPPHGNSAPPSASLSPALWSRPPARRGSPTRPARAGSWSPPVAYCSSSSPTYHGRRRPPRTPPHRRARHQARVHCVRRACALVTEAGSRRPRNSPQLCGSGLRVPGTGIPRDSFPGKDLPVCQGSLSRRWIPSCPATATLDTMYDMMSCI